MKGALFPNEMGAEKETWLSEGFPLKRGKFGLFCEINSGKRVFG